MSTAGEVITGALVFLIVALIIVLDVLGAWAEVTQ